MTLSSNSFPFQTPILIAGIIKREPTILQILYDSYAPAVYGRILSVVTDSACAIHILEDSFVYAVEHIEEHNPQLRLYTWFLQIAQFKILGELSSALTGRSLSPELHLDEYRAAWHKLHLSERELLEATLFNGYWSEETEHGSGGSAPVTQRQIDEALIHFHDLLS